MNASALYRYMSRGIVGYATALLATSAGTGAIVALNHIGRVPNVSLLYIPVILFTAVYFGTWASLFAATVAVLQYDFFLLQPIFTFSIARVEDLLAFGIFAIVAILTSQLAARARERAETAQRRATESTMLYELGQVLMSTHDVSSVLDAMTKRIVEVFGVDRCAVFIPGSDGQLRLAAETLRGAVRDRASQATASWVFEKGTQVWLPMGDTGALDQQRVYVPLRVADQTVGVMEIGRKRGEVLDGDERRLVFSFAAQAALLVARAQGEEARHRLAVVEDSDRLKSALLNAVSHDLRTPLASIKASATALLLADEQWTSEERRDFLQTIDDETDRLNRLVGNLLDLSRIQAGVLRPAFEWYDMQEVVDTVVPHVSQLLRDRPFEVHVQSGIPAIQLDLLRVEELMVNLIENAVKYTPVGSPIEMHVIHGPLGVTISVVDHGPGVPLSHRARIFETFYRGHRHGDREPGTGLGLAICRGVAEVHGGTIRVEETPGGGATFVFHIPASRLSQDVSA